MRDARKLSWGFGGRDSGSILAVLNFYWPREANWDPIFTLLEEPLVSGEDKRGVADFLSRYYTELPPMVKDWLRDHAESLASQPQIQHAKFQQPVGATLTALAIQSGGLSEQQSARALANAFARPSQSRIDMTGSLRNGLHSKDPLIFIPLLGDADPKVRRQAAEGLIGLVSDDQPSDTVMAALEVAILGEGALVALTVAARLRQRASAGASWPLTLLENCEQHPSAAVRLAARVGRTL
ncbi:hypothetical protein DQ239_02485 [Blastococcus sp. TF02-09]|nr:hypothetical protein DQ239_02485 [Blastococcus sp. TF02-9]